MPILRHTRGRFFPGRASFRSLLNVTPLGWGIALAIWGNMGQHGAMWGNRLSAMLDLRHLLSGKEHEQ